MHTRSSSQCAGDVVWCVTTAHRVVMSGCSTMLVLLGCGRGGTARCLTGSVIIACIATESDFGCAHYDAGFRDVKEFSVFVLI